jgi:chromosome segregation ATPase
MQDIEGIFRDELRQFFFSKERIQEHLAKANQFLTDKKQHLEAHTHKLDKVRGEMRKVYQLFQADQITPEGFGKLYRPLEDQERALAAELPKLQGEVDAMESRQLSADEVVSEAFELHRMWPELSHEKKRALIESIAERIVVSSDAIDITYCYMPSSEELTKRQRNLWDSWRPPA